MLNLDENAEKLLEKIEKQFDADVFLYAGEINPLGFASLVEKTFVINDRKKNNALLILYTDGGNPDFAYKIVRILQNMYSELIIYAPGRCKSAGSLMMLGAHKVIMGELSEMGPLDVQLAKKDEITEAKSSLLMKSTLDFMFDAARGQFTSTLIKLTNAFSTTNISFAVTAELASKLTSNLMSPIFSQLNPEEIGSDYRHLRIAEEYGDRLAKVSNNFVNRKRTIFRLIQEYPSHGFVIDKEEAKELFKNVKEPTNELLEFSLNYLDNSVRSFKTDPDVMLLNARYQEKPTTKATKEKVQNQTEK